MKTLLALASLALFNMSTIAADGPVFHVVHFKFKADATPDQIANIEKEFAALKGKIDVVQTLEWGTDISLHRPSGAQGVCRDSRAGARRAAGGRFHSEEIAHSQSI